MGFAVRPVSQRLTARRAAEPLGLSKLECPMRGPGLAISRRCYRQVSASPGRAARQEADPAKLERTEGPQLKLFQENQSERLRLTDSRPAS